MNQHNFSATHAPRRPGVGAFRAAMEMSSSLHCPGGSRRRAGELGEVFRCWCLIGWEEKKDQIAPAFPIVPSKRNIVEDTRIRIQGEDLTTQIFKKIPPHPFAADSAPGRLDGGRRAATRAVIPSSKVGQKCGDRGQIQPPPSKKSQKISKKNLLSSLHLFSRVDPPKCGPPPKGRSRSTSRHGPAFKSWTKS